MSLLQVKDYVKNQGKVSLFDLSNQFNIEPDILREMLKLLVSKGKLRSQTKTVKCGTKCVRCLPTQFEVYEWIEHA